LSYKVIKWIKGHAYLYEQETYRVGGKVKTKSRYIGVASDSDVRTFSSANGTKKPENTNTESNQRPTETEKAFTSAEVPAVPQVNTTNNSETSPDPSPPLDIKVDFNRYTISERSLQKEYETFTKRIAAIGLDTSKMTPIRIVHGKEIKHHKSWYSKSYTVMIPRSSKYVNTTKFKLEFSKALARSGLDLLQKQRPDMYVKLAERFDESFRRTQEALTVYILNSQDRNRIYKAIALKWFGKVYQLQRNIPNPERVGLIDYSERKSWDDELVTIMADIQKNGLRAVKQKQGKEFAIARNEMNAAFEDYKSRFVLSPLRAKAKKRWKRARVRLEAHKEMFKKLELIQSVFYL